MLRGGRRASLQDPDDDDLDATDRINVNVDDGFSRRGGDR